MTDNTSQGYTHLGYGQLLGTGNQLTTLTEERERERERDVVIIWCMKISTYVIIFIRSSSSTQVALYLIKLTKNVKHSIVLKRERERLLNFDNESAKLFEMIVKLIVHLDQMKSLKYLKYRVLSVPVVPYSTGD